jgi:hypothetical protein
VLRYVCEHMDPTWAAGVLERTAGALARRAERNQSSVPDWQMVLYVGRKLGAATPEALARAVAARKERAVALAWVFRKAGLLVKEEERMLLVERAEGDGVTVNKRREKPPADARQLALWEVMASVPDELRKVIAFEAHLISH